jgi:hypothetical protein
MAGRSRSVATTASTRALIAEPREPDSQVELVVALAIPTTSQPASGDRNELIRTRRAAVEHEAAPVIAAVEGLGGSAERPSWLTNTVTVRIPASAIEDLAADLQDIVGVVSITADVPVEFEVPVLLEEDAEPAVHDPG